MDLQFEQTVGEVTREINRIRGNRVEEGETKLKVFEISQQVAMLIYLHMKRTGAFYKTQGNIYYFHFASRKLIPIHDESDELELLLHLYGMNASEKIYQYVIRELFFYGKTEGVFTEVHHYTYYLEATNTLYIANGNEEVLKVTKSGVETCLNGTDGVLFLPNRKIKPFNRVPFDRAKHSLDSVLLDGINFASTQYLTAQDQRIILGYYLTSLFFGSILVTRAILCPIAEKGSGKTSLLRMIGQLLFGPDFEVVPLPNKEDDFIALITNSIFVALDNVDEKCSWLNDRLACYATGQTITKRELYTTNNLIEFKPDVFLAINSRTPKFRRDDVAERLLPLHLEPLQAGKRPEKMLQKEIQAKRDAFMSYMVEFWLPKVLQALEADSGEGFTSQFRIADFAQFCYRVSKFFGGQESLMPLLDKISISQVQFALETNPVVDALEQIKHEHPGREWFARELNDALVVKAMEMGFTYSMNTITLGRWLNHNASSLQQLLGLQFLNPGGNKTLYAFHIPFSLNADPPPAS